MRRAVTVLAVAGLVGALALLGGAAAGQAGNGNPDNGQHSGQLKNTGPNYNSGKALAISKAASEKITGQPPLGPAKVGSIRTWLALDDFQNFIYLKNYTLRGVGKNIEVWVANNLAFPAHNGTPDCRNALRLTQVTDAQVQNFIGEFDSNIYPKESETFSVPPNRDGHKALLPTLIPNLPSSEYKGEGDNIVVLVDNVRDANFYEPTSPDGHTYIAGFFYSVFNEYTNRNIMTVDAFDWLHRTTATPPDNSGEAAYQACNTELGNPSTPVGSPRPHLYEGVFAHEYQHLLEYYSDPDELSWVNEGLSDWAQTLVGYVDPNIPHGQPGADSHLSCFQGWLDPSFGGPENSLTNWGDQGGPEILCDYGAAYSIMQMLATRYGDGFMTDLHRDPGNGLQGLNDVLTANSAGKSAEDIVHEWAALAALDSKADTSLTGGSNDDYTSSGLFSEINWTNPEAYSDPGAPPNGSDYVELGPVSGLTSIDFQGDATLPPHLVEWTSVTDAPDHAGDAALYSGAANNRDAAIVRQVSFSPSPSLTFDAFWNEEDGWDFGFVQVSTDNGATYHSLTCTDTTTTTDPGALPTAKNNVPGFTGYSGGWKAESCDVSAYASQNVWLSFRAFNDPGVLGSAGAPQGTPAGFWVDDVAVDGSVISDGSSLAGWQSPTQVNPIPVSGFTVQLVAYDGSGNAWYHNLQVDSGFHGSLTGSEITDALGPSATTVGAIVMQDDATETITDQAGYTLTINGTTVMPGGH